MTNWNELRSQSDLDGLLRLFGGFHDGCLREAHVWTEHFVTPDLHMHCSPELDTAARLLIQRQAHSPSAVELLFEQVTMLHLKPSPPNYDSIIFGATLLCRDDTFYWSDTEDWHPEQEGSSDATWIGCKKLSWRDASEWMGAELRYGG